MDNSIVDNVSAEHMTPAQLVEYATTLAAMLRRGADRIEAEVRWIVASQTATTPTPSQPPAPSGG